VIGRRQETDDVTTLWLEPLAEGQMTFRTGQFNMLTVLGVGEAAISISSAPEDPGPLRHTIRDVGPVTRALCRTGIGGLVWLRGPFGSHWGLHAGEGGPTKAPGDVVVMAGGIGLAPLRGAVHELVDRRARDGRRVFVLVGVRSPAQVMFAEDLERWSRAGAHVSVTVDLFAPGWKGPVGLVTSLLGDTGFDPDGASALVCGPEIMMRFTARALVDRGIDPGRIQLSLERNMQCALGWCGHCQLGPLLLCRDGPIVQYSSVVESLLSERQR
jgi:anaerobic sulfite reductase subunit B